MIFLLSTKSVINTLSLSYQAHKTHCDNACNQLHLLNNIDFKNDS